MLRYELTNYTAENLVVADNSNRGSLGEHVSHHLRARCGEQSERMVTGQAWVLLRTWWTVAATKDIRRGIIDCSSILAGRTQSTAADADGQL